MERGRSLICERKVKAEEAAVLAPLYVWDAIILVNLHCRYLWWFYQRDGWWQRWPSGCILLLATIFFQSHRGPGTFFFFFNTFIVYSNSVISTQCYFLMFLLNFCQLIIWSCASPPLYEDIAVILIFRNFCYFLVSHTVVFLFFSQENHSATANVLHVKCLDAHVCSERAIGRGDCGTPTVQKHPFMPLLRLSIVKRKWVCIVWSMKWNTQPSC